MVVAAGKQRTSETIKSTHWDNGTDRWAWNELGQAVRLRVENQMSKTMPILCRSVFLPLCLCFCLDSTQVNLLLFVQELIYKQKILQMPFPVNHNTIFISSISQTHSSGFSHTNNDAMMLSDLLKNIPFFRVHRIQFSLKPFLCVCVECEALRNELDSKKNEEWE